MKTCFKTEIAGYNIELQQRERRPYSFFVLYGEQHKNYLDYEQAAKELGACIMHALACEGNLNNED